MIDNCFECSFFKNGKLAERVVSTRCNYPDSCQNCPVLKTNSYVSGRIDELIRENNSLKEQLLETKASISEVEYTIRLKDAIIKDKDSDIVMLKTMIGELIDANNKR